MQAKTIDEVIEILNQIVEDCKKNNNPLGYFAVLYRQVTCNVRDGIQNKQFDDNARMEQLDVHFANRYFKAYFDFKAQHPITKSWEIAFLSSQKKYLVMQYLLQGINAHINLDLGIATVLTCEGHSIEGIKKDFYGINTLLASMVDGVQQQIGAISPLFKILMPLTRKWDDKLAQFTIELARDGAWDFALQYQASTNKDQLLVSRDKKIEQLGFALVKPSLLFRWIVNTVLFFESGSVRKNMEILEGQVKGRV
ncbi:DUF5995 family protein [Flavobacterium sp.]|uniref:DUF5995 family protein n=1 Tax=Flavobacterium sp. TaxID=239 RepID=UPI003D0C25BC